MTQAVKTPGPIDHWLKLRDGLLEEIPDSDFQSRETLRVVLAVADLIFRKLEDIEKLLKEQGKGQNSD